MIFAVKSDDGLAGGFVMSVARRSVDKFRHVRFSQSERPNR